MRLSHKLLIFLSLNFVVAFLAALAPASLTNGTGFHRHAVVYDFIESVEPGTKISVLLGDSRSECCIDAKSIGFTNLSITGGTPVEGYYILKRLVDRGVDVDRLILSFGPFHIFTQDVFHSQTRYFGLIDDEYAGQVLEEAEKIGDKEYLTYGWTALEVLDDSLPFLSDGFKYRLVNVLSIDRTIEQVWNGWSQRDALDADRPRTVADPRFKLTDSTPAARTNTDGEESPEFLNPNAESPINEIYLSKIVDLAVKEGIETAYLVMPFNRDMKHPPKSYYERYFSIIDESGFSHCRFGNEWWGNDSFSDTHHLNEAGSEQFNASLASGLSFCSPRETVASEH